ncbi:unnamed protein product [Musa hybrid cultivar]
MGKLTEDVKQLINMKKGIEDQLQLIDHLQQLGVAYQFKEDIKDALWTIYRSMEEVNMLLKDNLHATALMFRLLREHGFLKVIFAGRRSLSSGERLHLGITIRYAKQGTPRQTMERYVASTHEGSTDPAVRLTPKTLKRCSHLIIPFHSTRSPRHRPVALTMLTYARCQMTAARCPTLALRIIVGGNKVCKDVAKRVQSERTTGSRIIIVNEQICVSRNGLVHISMSEVFYRLSWMPRSIRPSRRGVDQHSLVCRSRRRVCRAASLLLRGGCCYRRITNLHIYLANQMTLTVLLARKPPSAHLIHSVFQVEDKLANICIRIAFDATTMLQWTMMHDGREFTQFLLSASVVFVQDELERGDVPKSIQCYMHESSLLEYAALYHIRRLIRDRSFTSRFGENIKMMIINVPRMAQCMYQYGDGHGKPNQVIEDRIRSLMVEPKLL